MRERDIDDWFKGGVLLRRWSWVEIQPAVLVAALPEPAATQEEAPLPARKSLLARTAAAASSPRYSPRPEMIAAST